MVKETPIIYYNNEKFSIMMDGFTICEFKNYYDALFYFLISFYSFNIIIPNDITKSARFLLSYLLEIDIQIPKGVQTLINKCK